jgi:hypothetical protein
MRSGFGQFRSAAKLLAKDEADRSEYREAAGHAADCLSAILHTRFILASETRCPMKLKTAARSARCGSGREIWIATIFVARVW